MSRKVPAKEHPDTKVVVCEPANLHPDAEPAASARNAVRRFGDGRSTRPGTRIQKSGWGPDFIPKLTGDVVETNVMDRVITISGADAMRCSRQLAQQEERATFAGARCACRRHYGTLHAQYAAPHFRGSAGDRDLAISTWAVPEPPTAPTRAAPACDNAFGSA